MVARNSSQRFAASGASQRQLRVGELVRHKLSQMLSRGQIHDDVLSAHVITIPEVRMSPDLKVATAYVMRLGGGDMSGVIAALNANRKYIRGQVARAVALKFAPDVRFYADKTFDEAMRIDALLHDTKVGRDVGSDDL